MELSLCQPVKAHTLLHVIRRFVDAAAACVSLHKILSSPNAHLLTSSL